MREAEAKIVRSELELMHEAWSQAEAERDKAIELGSLGLWLFEELRYNVGLLFSAVALASQREQRVLPTGVRLALQHLGWLYGLQVEEALK